MEKYEFCVDFINTKFILLSDGKNIVQAKQWLNKRCSDSALLETMFKRWHADFKCGRTDTNDVEHSGHPNSAVHKLVLVDCKLKLHGIVEKLKISESSVFTILHEHLSLRKLC